MRALTHLRAAVVLVVVLAAGCPGRPNTDLTFGIDELKHDTYFPIAAGTKHALGRTAEDGAIACASCHAAGSDSFKEFQCTTCHEHRVEQMAGVHAGIQLYRFESASCLTCHPRGDADIEIDDATHTRDYFPIDDPSAHATISCSECHTDAADRKVVGCTSCHEHEALAMQQTHGTMPGYQWDSPTCLTCHDRAQNPGKLDHPYFPTSSGDKHEGVSCKECHASAQDRGALACITCHEHNQQETNEQHQGVPEYAYDSGSCILCHRNAQVPGVIEHTFFPIAGGTTHALGNVVDQGGGNNAPISCASCHQNPADQSYVACTTCHAHEEAVLAPTHSAIPGYVHTDSACLLCHPNGEPTGLIEHLQFPITAGTPHTGLACTECHASTTNPQLLACTSCHQHTLELTEPSHRSMPGFEYDSAACFACHDQAQVPGRFDHEPLFPLNAPSVHTGLSCRDCHTDPASRRTLSCTACHTGTHDQAPMATVHTGIPNYSWTPASCVGCHPTGSADNAVFNHTYFPIAEGSIHAPFDCIDCHTNPNDNTVVSCTACHLGTHDQAPMTTTHAGVPGFSWNTTQCLFCHPNSEPSGNMDHEIYFPLNAPAAHNGIACADCHIDANNRHTLGCAQCHASDTNPTIAQLHNGIPGFANSSPACLSCHPRSQPVGPMEHSAYFPIASGTRHAGSAYNAKIAATENSCSACHLSRTDRAQNDCAACHASVSPVPSSSHGRVRGFLNASLNCKQCHGDAQVENLNNHTVFRFSHHGAKCIDCHRSFRTDKPFALDFNKGVCTRCHSSTCTPQNQGPCD